MDELIDKVCAYALSIFKCGAHSIHSLPHWQNVEDSGILICSNSPADLIVVRYFAYLHDCCRCDDGADLDHGRRASECLASLPSDIAMLSADQMSLLHYAIRHHTDGDVSENPTIGACWDSDRLDLGRVGIIPNENFMSTDPGREIARLGSRQLYIAQHVPGEVDGRNE